jgi:hypothetical protein
MRFDWKNMNDEMLQWRLGQEQRRSTRALKKKDRAMAKSNVEAIIREQVRRHEAKYGIE